jgi:hypothetical protein
MKKLLITLLLISPFSFADWGDTYFCSMTHHSIVTNEGKHTSLILENFKFQLDREKRAFVFDDSSAFKRYDRTVAIGIEYSLPIPKEIIDWYAGRDGNTYLSFKKGKAVYTYNLFTDVTIITADCDKLE